MTSFDEARKTLAKTEKHLAKIRQTRTELETAAADAQSKLDAALADREAALAAGRVGDLARHGGIIENCRIVIRSSQDDLDAIAQAEHVATGSLVAAEKACQHELRNEWDAIADQAKEELVTACGPLLRRFWQAGYSGNYPVPLSEVLRSLSIGLKTALEDSAQAAPEPEFPLPEHVESGLLSHADRSQFQRHAQG